MKTDIEKCAKLMGYDVSTPEEDTMAMSMPHAKDSAWVTKGEGGWVWFNPRTNKADLMDLECELGIDTKWITNMSGDVVAAVAEKWAYGLLEVASSQLIAYHPSKFAARARAVIAVAEQIYDAKYGKKDGE